MVLMAQSGRKKNWENRLIAVIRFSGGMTLFVNFRVTHLQARIGCFRLNPTGPLPLTFSWPMTFTSLQTISVYNQKCCGV